MISVLRLYAAGANMADLGQSIQKADASVVLYHPCADDRYAAVCQQLRQHWRFRVWHSAGHHLPAIHHIRVSSRLGCRLLFDTT